MTALRFVTWQFVRLMVRLEETADQDSQRRDVLAAWQADWTALDEQLGALAETDFDAYADLMMNHELVLEPESAAGRTVIREALTEVAAQLRSEAANAAGDARQDLEFEAASLGDFVAALQVESGGKG